MALDIEDMMSSGLDSTKPVDLRGGITQKMRSPSLGLESRFNRVEVHRIELSLNPSLNRIAR